MKITPMVFNQVDITVVVPKWITRCRRVSCLFPSCLILQHEPVNGCECFLQASCSQCMAALGSISEVINVGSDPRSHY
jgi:hypothetical protein